VKIRSPIDRVLLLSASSGLLLALSFPRPNLFWLAWVALIPLLLVVKERPFAGGFTCGVVFFGVVLYWLNVVMTTYGGLAPVFSVIAYLLLIVYLSLFFGAATWVSQRLLEIYRLPLLVSLPVAWVALEYLRGWLFSGFPWALLGYSQQDFSLAIQSADITGVYGISLLLVAVNCALAWLIAAPRRRLAWAGAGLVVLMLISHMGYGYWRSSTISDERDQGLRLALIQGNIEQGVKWLPEQMAQTIEIYRQLSLQAAGQESGQSLDLLVWPEAATPFFLQEATLLAQSVRQLPQEAGSALLVGSPAYVRGAQGEISYYNSAYLLSGQGQELGRSDKQHLVPFGEYVPFFGLFGFVDKLVAGTGDFSSGESRPLELKGHKIGVLICYEAIFPRLARSYTRLGSELLVNLTNDAWFGRSSAPYQHLAMTRFRAIENRIWVARAANTGISALISPSGKVVAATPLFERLSLGGTVGLGAETTFYTRYGDLFALVCLGLFCCGCVALVRERTVRKT
jgi:apolipoprotein N-acyltransferase